MSGPSAPRLYVAYAALALRFAISLTYRVRDTVDRIDELRHGDTIARLPFDFDLPQLTIGSLQPEAVRYVNAGHNPPLVFRRSTGEVIRLDACGPVIGLIQGCQWTEACVPLQPGDLLVAFTDGISEAMNRDDEKWGEERPIETVNAPDSLPAAQMIGEIRESADQFVAGAPQHDDMTVVVLRSADTIEPAQ